MTSVRKHDGKDSVIAVSCSDSAHLPSRAVKLKRSSEGFELLWKKSSDDLSYNISFVKSLVTDEQSGDSSNKSASFVVSFDSSAAAFYKIQVPPVDDLKLPPIVQMQIEALLPAVAVKMRTAWFAHPQKKGNRLVTVAVARDDHLENALPIAKTIDASEIFLDCQSVTKAWSELFEKTEKTTLLINIRDKSIQLLLVENSQMIDAMTLDIDMSNLTDSEDFATRIELFVHDFRSALMHLGIEQKDIDIRLLSPQAETHQQIIDYLNLSGISVSSSTPDMTLLSCPLPMEPQEVCDDLDIIGAAMLDLDSQENQLNIFEDIYLWSKCQKTVRKSVPILPLAVVVLVMFLVFGFVAKTLDKKELGKLKNADTAKLLERENTRKTIAQQRVDILKIMDKINKCKPKDMLLDSFSYKNKTVTIASHANSFEQIHKFEKDLESQAGFSNLKGQNPVKDEKTKKIAFKLTFLCK